MEAKDKELYEMILMQVAKPARYIGNEINMVKKNLETVSIRFGLCFPDSYEIGMSNLGMQLLYYFINRRNDAYCERFFAPYFDMEEKMREHSLPLMSLETFSIASKFDFIGFTLHYEMCYTNMLNMMNLGGIPLLSAERDDSYPIICAGGPCVYNPEPLADFVDFFYIGEGEEKLDEILDIYKVFKLAGKGKQEYFSEIAKINGIYVPNFYDIEYQSDGIIKSRKPNHENAKEIIQKVYVRDLDNAFYPEKMLVPHIEAVHDRVVLELFRGCIRGCRFCQAGYIYRPAREKSSETLIKNADALIDATGHDEISLLSLSTSDYTNFNQLMNSLIERFTCHNVNVSLPSLRVDSMSLSIMEKVQSVRKSSLTFAPEAGSQRLRNVINKNLSEQEILDGCHLAFLSGWDKIKLYFMIGLPTETDDDIKAIAALADKVVAKYYEVPKERRLRPVSINVSASCFVPKPHTAFQWEGQNTSSDLRKKGMEIKRTITRKQVRYAFHDERLSIIEGALTRGDRRLSAVIKRVYEKGGRFEGWGEHFSFERWEAAFAAEGLTIAFYAERERDFDEILPWDHISCGVSKEFLMEEAKKARGESVTPDCHTVCALCGIACSNGMVGAP